MATVRSQEVAVKTIQCLRAMRETCPEASRAQKGDLKLVRVFLTKRDGLVSLSWWCYKSPTKALEEKRFVLAYSSRGIEAIMAEEMLWQEQRLEYYFN